MTHNYDDADEILMGLMFDKPEPHLAEDENMGDEAFVNMHDDWSSDDFQ